MRRREFVAFIGGALAAPLGRAQVRMPRICYLGASTQAASTRYWNAFVDGMREHGWIDGRNVRIESRWADGRLDLLANLAGEIVKAGYDVILASGLTAARAVRAHTSTVPIVSALLHDPVAERMATSWSRPGGNITGTSTINHELLRKRVQIIREIVPGMKSLAVVFDPALPNLRHGFDNIAAISSEMGMRAAPFDLITVADIDPVFARIKQQRCEAAVVPAYPLATTRRAAIAAAAIRLGLPTVGESVDFATDGFLASHGPDWVPLFRRSTSHVDRILRGAKPGDLPIEQPLHYELILNQKTAVALSIRFPQMVLLRADRVIE